MTLQLQDTIRRATAKANREKLELELHRQLRSSGLAGGVEREVQFHPQRRWRFDFAWRDDRLAVEVEGLSGGAGGRHQRIGGYERDLEKYNEAALRGWRVLRFSGGQVNNGVALAMIRRALSG